MSKQDEAPRYRVLDKSFIGHNLVEAGEEIDYDGVPGDNLSPLNEAAEEAKRLAPTDIAKAEDKLLTRSATATRIVEAPDTDKAIEAALAKREKAHAKELEDQRKAHEKELAELREQAKAPKKTGGGKDDPNADPTLVARGGETELADPVAGQGPHSDPNSALSPAQRRGAVEASKGGEGKNDTAAAAGKPEGEGESDSLV